MDKERLQQLSREYLDGTLQPGDWELLKAHLTQDAAHPEFESALTAALEQEATAAADVIVLERILHHVHSQKSTQPVPVRTLYPRKGWWAAAAVLLLMVAGAYIWLRPLYTGLGTNNNIARIIDLPAGKQGAILTLADGSQVVLDSLGNGVIAQQNGAQVVLQNGKLVYDPTRKSTGEVVYNTMATPKGRAFHLVLPDGTQVWLNAASSIRYPTFFTSGDRKVEVTGEAYFEVAKDKAKPFIVDVAGRSAVEVLGTAFNVNAYLNETSINTTLLEGSIRVKDNRQSVILTPGQQAQVAADQAVQNNIRVVNARLDKTMAWKNGLISLDGASLEEVMRQLERWYDIEVVFEGSTASYGRLRGEMDRGLTLLQVLKALSQLEIQYKLEGRKLIIL